MNNKKEIGIGNPPIYDSRWIKVTKQDLHGWTDEELIEKKRRDNIRNGMTQSLKKIGRPKKIDDETLKKAYSKWLSGQITQKEISIFFNISERTVNRRFKSLI